MRFLEKLHIKKREKSKLKTETEIRGRRRELFGIRENWIETGEENMEDIDAVIAEFDWILCEEKEQDSYSELLNAKRQIKELETENRKLQITINLSRRD